MSHDIVMFQSLPKSLWHSYFVLMHWSLGKSTSYDIGSLYHPTCSQDVWSLFAIFGKRCTPDLLMVVTAWEWKPWSGSALYSKWLFYFCCMHLGMCLLARSRSHRQVNMLCRLLFLASSTWRSSSAVPADSNLQWTAHPTMYYIHLICLCLILMAHSTSLFFCCTEAAKGDPLPWGMQYCCGKRD